ncbi:MAG: hypothetical protein DRI23_09150, partial [Candidatus Cloacimonadota bacterium]
EAQEVIKELSLKNRQLRNSQIIFNIKVVNAIVSFYLAETIDEKSEKGIKHLEQMLKQEDDEERIAELNKELWKMKREFSKKEAESYRIAAYELYQKLYQKIPKFQTKLIIEELEQNS